MSITIGELINFNLSIHNYTNLQKLTSFRPGITRVPCKILKDTIPRVWDKFDLQLIVY